ncbi:hypothetical protein Ae201684P_002641 [Aphanomyces euteiches]|uniref:Uncharacterized protein n=1 Tax=Aphanomyces euteiches TaxID=100861 RepID=A0A6G0X298_9STRA|nr:hypothetical protein Ae201684_009176 [Aphanomyces euteiches]KAH9070279.1 hypothetical protein Ae201684P_002641 [Aphanomyces euteiches]
MDVNEVEPPGGCKQVPLHELIRGAAWLEVLSKCQRYGTCTPERRSIPTVSVRSRQHKVARFPITANASYHQGTRGAKKREGLSQDEMISNHEVAFAPKRSPCFW